ncbi:capsular biosynthesis protein [Enterobacteriaceae bacterium RIT691]|nr:capsular biosynthesis protein [Enterobacteriaceae bacterium RIT691]
MRSRLTLMVGLLYFPVAHADLQPKQHIGVAGLDFESQVGYDVGYNDNVTWQHDENRASATNYQRLTPSLSVSGKRYEDQYLLAYTGDYRQYQSDSADNRSDHTFLLAGNWRLGQMHGVEVNLYDALGHEDRGKDSSEGFTPEQFQEFGINKPIATHFTSGQVRYTYGAPEGRGHASVALQHTQLRYRDLNTIHDTDVDFYNYMLDQEWHTNSLIAEIFDQKAKNLRYRYSFITNQRRYELNPLKDSNEYYFAVTMRNHFTSQIEVNAYLAWLYKGFLNNPDSSPFSGLNWDVDSTWTPLKQIKVNLHSSKTIKDPSDSGGYTQVMTNGLSYEHHWWVDRFSTIVDYSHITESYKNESDGRRDKKNLLSLTFNYDFRPSINFKLKLQWDTLHSNKKTDVFFIGPDNDREVDRTLGYDDSAIIFMTQVQI